MFGADPLIVTAHLDDRAFTVLDALRRKNFPSKLNRIPAHVSLFHKLPGEEIDAVRSILAATCGATRPFAMAPSELRSLGRGVAIAYRSPELEALRRQLAERWAGWLSAQDRQGFRAHVTVQNKVEPAVARALLEGMREGVEPPTCQVEGLDLWHYRGGPWEHVETCRFSTAAA